MGSGFIGKSRGAFRLLSLTSERLEELLMDGHPRPEWDLRSLSLKEIIFRIVLHAHLFRLLGNSTFH